MSDNKEVMDAPAPYDMIIEAVNDRDRKWFEDNPGEQSYVRPYVPGEFWPADESGISAVRVFLLGPGLRARQTLSAGDLE